MSKKDIEDTVSRLRKQINDLRHRYHVENDPSVTDTMYEGLLDKLRKLEYEYPELVDKYSPTQRVAGKPLSGFRKIKHAVPQWSFNDAFSEEDLLNWVERINKYLEKELGFRPTDLDFICEYKIDGLHIVLNYVNGKLITAATRGDGKIGEDVTENIRTFQTVPLRLKKDVTLVAEGEAWLPAKMLDKINKKRAKNNEQLFSNPRNAAAGTIRQLNPQVVADRKLVLTAYDISAGEIPGTQAAELDMLSWLGFKTDNNWKVCKKVGEIVTFWKKAEKNKKTKPFWVDGVVVKVNQKKYQDALGFTGKAPRWAIALKFAAEQGTTKIKDIYVQVGRTGALTPVALMEPVKLAGTTVTHATLHNFDEIKRLRVKVGDTVVVEKAGDIIPKVVRVLEKMRTGSEKKIFPPKKCPICNSNVERRKIQDKKQAESAALFCINKNCYAQELQRFSHFVSKKAFNIDGLGGKIIEQLVQQGLIKNPADLFVLTAGDLKPLERFAEKAADNLVKSINTAKSVTLPRFLFALGIDQVGEETAVRLSDSYGTLDKLLKANIEDLERVEDVGPTVAKSIVNYFAIQDNLKYLEELKSNGVLVEKHSSAGRSGNLDGKTFVVTGTLENLTRDEAKDLIRNNGGNVSSSVSKNTDYILAGAEPGSKYDKGVKLNLKILSEKEFRKMI